MNPTLQLPRILFAFLLLIVVSCSTTTEEVSLEENLEQQELKEKQLQAERIASERITQNTSLTHLLEKSKVFEGTTSSKTVYNPQWGFSVNTEEAMFTTFGDYHSYTFEIFRDSPNGLLENLVISLQRDGSYKSWLIAYNFDDEDYAKIARNEYIAGLEKRASITEIDIEAGIIISDLAANENDPCKKKEVSRATGWTIEIAADCEDGTSSGNGNDNPINTDPNGAQGDPNYPGNSTGGDQDNSNQGDGQGGGGSSGNGDSGPACFDCNGIDFSTLITAEDIHQLNIDLGFSYASSNAFWLRSFENKNTASQLINYLNNFGQSEESIGFIRQAVNSLISGYVANLNEFISRNRNPTSRNTTGDINNNPLGGYDTTIYSHFDPQQQTWPRINPIIPVSDFIGWGYPGIERNCFSYAKAQIAKKGYTVSNYFNNAGQTIQIYTELNGVNRSELSKALSYLTYALKNGIPVVVGVDNKSGSPNQQTDSTTDHFIVVVGMGTDSKGKYFQVFDNASSMSPEDFGASSENKLYYDANKGIITGRTKTPFSQNSNYNPYIITMIRKSKRLN